MTSLNTTTTMDFDPLDDIPDKPSFKQQYPKLHKLIYYTVLGLAVIAVLVWIRVPRFLA